MAVWYPYFVFIQQIQTVQNVSMAKKIKKIKMTQTVGTFACRFIWQHESFKTAETSFEVTDPDGNQQHMKCFSYSSVHQCACDFSGHMLI